MPSRRILQLGDPLLRAVSTPVSDVSATEIVFRDLRATLHEFRRTHGFGRGISAVQIGEPTRLIYIEMAGEEYRLVNPELESSSGETFRLWDDCFSFPGVLVFLERAQSVVVRYLNERGEPKKIAASGAFSELLQHELDHLDGVLAIDRAIDSNSFRTREEYTRNPNAESRNPLIVLASGSPRRGEILSNAGIPYVRQVPPPVDETPAPGEEPREYVMRLAREKASAIAPGPHVVVLGADTTVAVDGEIFGKPSDAAEAARMLRRLSGRMHEVITGICLNRQSLELVDSASTLVWFKTLSESEIDAYVRSGEPMDKAGAYGIQGLASKFVTQIEGCYFNVVGLPISLVYTHLLDS